MTVSSSLANELSNTHWHRTGGFVTHRSRSIRQDLYVVQSTRHCNRVLFFPERDNGPLTHRLASLLSIEIPSLSSILISSWHNQHCILGYNMQYTALCPCQHYLLLIHTQRKHQKQHNNHSRRQHANCHTGLKHLRPSPSMVYKEQKHRKHPCSRSNKKPD